jgi:DNA ligase-1
MSIYNIIKELADTASRNDKIDILTREKDNQLLKQVLVAALNPFTQYYIRKIPSYKQIETTDIGLEDAVGLLSDLSNRIVTGTAGSNYLKNVLQNLPPEKAQVIEWIIGKDLRCGVQDSTVNKVWKDLIPTFEVMLADKWSDKHVVYPTIVQPKLDGLRVLAFVEEDRVTFKSRGGKEFTTLAHIEADILRSGVFTGYVLDGEIISGSFQNTVSDVKRKTVQNTDAILYAFDCLTLDEFANQKCELTQASRNVRLESLLIKNDITTVKTVGYIVCSTKEAVMQTYDEYTKAGYEGAITKKIKGLYEFKRSKNWLKIKPIETVDVEIIGFLEGTGKHAGRLGAFVVMFEGKECQVGGGFSDEQRTEFWNTKELLIGSLIEVLYMEKTEDGAMRHPRFIKVRSFKGAKA